MATFLNIRVNLYNWHSLAKFWGDSVECLQDGKWWFKCVFTTRLKPTTGWRRRVFDTFWSLNEVWKEIKNFIQQCLHSLRAAWKLVHISSCRVDSCKLACVTIFVWKSDKKCDKILFIDLLPYCLVGFFFLFVITFYVIGIIWNCFGVSQLNTGVQNKLAVLKNKSSDYFHFYVREGARQREVHFLHHAH